MVYEDFQNDYTEVDDDVKLEPATVRVTHASFERNDNGYFWKDFGANYFGNNLSFAFDVRIADVEAGDVAVKPWVKIVQLGNAVERHPNPRCDVRCLQKTDVDDVWHLYQDARDGGATVSDVDATDLAMNTTYYGWWKRTGGTDYSCDLYSSDADRQAENAPVAQTSMAVAGNTAFRYIMTTVGMNTVVNGTDHGSGWMENYDLTYAPAVRHARLLVGVGL